MKTLTTPLFTLFLLIAGAASMPLSANDANDQTNQTRTSSNGHFEVTIDSWLKPLKLGRMHAWTATVRNPEGVLVTDADVRISGGMPIHNHGFPTDPEMTRQLEDGVYLLEGFKFSMGGPWVIILDITANGETDSVAFDVNM